MRRLVKAVFSPAKLIIGVAGILAIGVVVGKVNILPKHVSAIACDSVDSKCDLQVATCRDASQDGISIPIPDGDQVNSDGFCEPIDVCPNIQGNQAILPAGYHLDDKGNCVQDPPQVLSDSTTVTDPGNPQVLAATTFAGK